MFVMTRSLLVVIYYLALAVSLLELVLERVAMPGYRTERREAGDPGLLWNLGWYLAKM